MPWGPVPAGQHRMASHCGPTWCLNQILDQISMHSCANHGLKPDDQVCERPGTPHMRGPVEGRKTFLETKTFSLGPFCLPREEGARKQVRKADEASLEPGPPPPPPPQAPPPVIQAVWFPGPGSPVNSNPGPPCAMMRSLP